MTLCALLNYINIVQHTWRNNQAFTQALQGYLSTPGNTIEDEVPYEGTLLKAALRSGSQPIVNILLRHGAFVNETAFIWAMNKIGILECLLTRLHLQSPDLAHNCLNQLFLMILELKNRLTIEWLLKKGVDINFKNQYGQTALMLAVEKGQFKLVKLLLDNQADIDAQDNNGHTALFYAAFKAQSSIDIMQLLLSKKPSLTIQDQFNQTVLIAAAKAGANRAVLALLKHNPIVLADPNGYRALNNALLSHKINVVKTLVEYGVNLKFLPSNLPVRIKNELFLCFEQALRLMPITTPLNLLRVYQHNLFMRSYAETAAHAIAIQTPLPIHVSSVVNTYLFRDPSLGEVYHEAWKKQHRLLFSPIRPKIREPSLEASPSSEGPDSKRQKCSSSIG